MRVGLVGCGTIADQHLSQVQRIKGCTVVGVCDSEELMAQQLAERFHVPYTCFRLEDLLRDTRPHVVHIATPPQSHLLLGRQCLESGVSVYMEKPFALNAKETRELIECAESHNAKVTVGHNLQFRSESERMRALVRAGFLGGPPLHMECIQCYNHDDPVYGKALLGDRAHWVRRLPGSLLHNVISHGVAKIAEFVSGAEVKVLSHASTSQQLKSLGHHDIVDEVRAVIFGPDGTTATFTFTTQFAAGANQFRLYGRTNAIIVDNLNRMLVKVPQPRYKSYMRYFLSPRVHAREYGRNAWHNIFRFLRRDFHEGNSMRKLIELFYRSVCEETPVPIPYREILATARIMDAIFGQIGQRSLAEPIVLGSA